MNAGAGTGLVVRSFLVSHATARNDIAGDVEQRSFSIALVQFDEHALVMAFDRV